MLEIIYTTPNIIVYAIIQSIEYSGEAVVHELIIQRVQNMKRVETETECMTWNSANISLVCNDHQMQINAKPK